MADTFDFRQYLPKDVLEGSDDEEVDNDVDSDEEELVNAIIEGGYAGGKKLSIYNL